MKRQIRRWHIYPDANDLAAHAANAILRAADEAIRVRGRFTVVLAGGTTPQQVYARLATARADWGRWYVYFSDERSVPVGDAERNDRRAYEAWLNHVPVPRDQVWRIPGELGPEAGAQRYAAVVAPLDQFDLVLLGLGEDGHVASLFPDLWRSGDSDDVVGVRGAPKPPPERISLGAARLSRARQVLFLVAGESKRRAIAAWRRGDDIPAASVAPEAGVDVLVDAAAWPDPL